MAAKKDDTEVQDFIEQANQLKEDFRERNKIHQAIDSLIYMKKEPRVPRGFPKTTKVMSPLATHIVNTVTAALSMNPYRHQFPPVTIGPSGEQNALLREHFFDGAWARQEQEKNARTFRLFMHSLVAKGESVIKTIERSKSVWAPYDKQSAALEKQLDDPNDDEYGDIATRYKDTGDRTERDRVYNAKTEEMKRGLSYPITSVYTPPDTFYFIKGEDGFSFQCEIKNVDYYQTLEKYGSTLTKDAKVVKEGFGIGRSQWSEAMSGTKQLTMYEMWRWDRCVYVLSGPGDDPKKGEGRVVRSFPHKYGNKELKTLNGPYFHSYGITTSSRENQYMGLSVLFGWMKLFPWLDELLTIQGAAAYDFGYPKYKDIGNPGDGEIRPDQFTGQDDQDKRDKRTNIEPGSILPWNIAPVDAPKSGVDLGKAIDICRELISLCLPNVVQGLVNGDESGYLAAQATHLARLVWQPIVDNAEFCLASRSAFEAWLIDKCIGEDVYVWGQEPVIPGKRKKARAMWLGIGPDDIKGIYAINVHLHPSTPSQDVVQNRMLGELLDKKLITPAMAIEEIGRNPEEVQLGWELEELKAQLLPDVIAKARAKILARQQTEANQANEAEAQAGVQSSGGADNGLAGTVNPSQPGQQGVPLQPTPAGQAGVQDVNAAGGLAATGAAAG